MQVRVVSTGRNTNLLQSSRAGPDRTINNFRLGGQGRYRTNVLDYPSVNSLDPARRGDLELHPTVKPIALIADLIRDCSRRNGIVLDPFGGSGTTILAAERAGRIARVAELDPLYVDLAIRRWQKATGVSALVEGTSDTHHVRFGTKRTCRDRFPMFWG